MLEQYGNIVDSVFSITYKEGDNGLGELLQRSWAKLLILNGGQRRDRTADAGLFRAPYQWT